jgi:hypothetical protein
MRNLLKVLFLLASGCLQPLTAAPAEDFKETIRPILEKHCFECHSDEKKKGDLNLQQFSDYEKVVTVPEVWATVLERVQAFEMPPEGKKELDFDKHGKLMRWLRELPKPQNADCDKIASDRSANFYRGYVMSRRLNRAEYINTIRDLFGVRIDLSDLLPVDGGGGEGFDTTGNALFTSTIHIEKYMAAADAVLSTILPETTRGATKEIKAAREAILLRKDVPPRKEAPAFASEILTTWGRKFYRRPIAAEEVERAMSMFNRGWKRGDSFIPSLRLALKSMLISPNFLFLVEPESQEKGVQPLGALPLASKLSYFLWSSMPDEELLRVAESGQLLEPNIYVQQIHRLLSDPKAEAVGERFAVQWLEIDRLGAEVRPDAKKYPEFDTQLEEAMRGEVIAHFNYVFGSNRSLVELLDSDYTFVNERLARIYEIPGIKGEELQQVTLTDKNRGGVTGMAAVHALTSYPLRTSPVLRGRWVLEALLGEKVPPPPPDVPALEETAQKAGHVSLREQLKIHRQKSECAGCHDKMDPLGFGMENFDNLGRWREQDNGFAIDAQGTLPNGQTFTGPAGLKTILIARKKEVMKHLVRKMTGYAYGRELNKFDECVVDRALEALEKNDYRAWVLVEQIALSFPFRHRFYPKFETVVTETGQ